MKVKVFFFTMILILILASCSDSDQSTLEGHIKSGLDSEVIKYNDIVYYEIKDDLIFVFYIDNQNYIYHEVLEFTPSKVNNIGKGGSVSMQGDFISFEKDDVVPYYITYFISDNSNVEKVEFNGQYIKNIKYNDVNFWVFINEQPVSIDTLNAYDSLGNQVDLIK